MAGGSIGLDNIPYPFHCMIISGLVGPIVPDSPYWSLLVWVGSPWLVPT